MEGPVRITVRVGGAGLLIGAYGLAPARRVSVLDAIDEGFSRSEGGWTRENRIRRRTYSRETGALLTEEIVAENARRLMTGRRAAGG